MITSTYGIKFPEDGDKGQAVFDALNSNFTIQRDHNHNGTNSAAIASSSLSKGTLNLDAVDWVSVAGGKGFKQTVSMPGVYTLVNCIMRFRVRTGANQHKIIHPSITPASITQFDVTVNDSTLDLEILFI